MALALIHASRILWNTRQRRLRQEDGDPSKATEQARDGDVDRDLMRSLEMIENALTSRGSSVEVRLQPLRPEPVLRGEKLSVNLICGEQGGQGQASPRPDLGGRVLVVGFDADLPESPEVS